MESIVAGYSDFAGLAKLRVSAQKDPVKSAEEVGRQFEAFFIKSMLASMRKASEPLKSELWNSNAMTSYQDMFDSELSTSLAKSGGLGVTEWLVGQVVGDGSTAIHNRSKGLSQYRVMQGAASQLGGARG